MQMSVLASGSFGRVVWVQHRLLGKEYVVKRSAAAIVQELERRAWCQACTGFRTISRECRLSTHEFAP